MGKRRSVVSYEPKDDYDANEMYISGVGGAADAVLSLIFLPSDAAPAHRWARLGVLQRVLELGFTAPKTAVINAMHDVVELRKSVDWLAEWPQPAKAHKALDSLASELEKLRRARPMMLRRETLFPPKVLVALSPWRVQKEQE